MADYTVSKSFPITCEMNDKNTIVMRMFGLNVERLKRNSVTHHCQLQISSGDIVYITGPSGSGKSTVIRELEKLIPPDQRTNLNDVALPEDRTLVECFDKDWLDSMRILSLAGLNDVFCILNTPANLSEGEKYRFRLAKTLDSGKKFIFADEFCSNLDRISASAISYNIRKNSKRFGAAFILASCHDDILMDLQPDVLVIKDFSGNAKVIYKEIAKLKTV